MCLLARAVANWQYAGVVQKPRQETGRRRALGAGRRTGSWAEAGRTRQETDRSSRPCAYAHTSDLMSPHTCQAGTKFELGPSSFPKRFLDHGFQI